ncbi:hypothetical protein [Streptomyces sp. NPDC088719]|uniref:hypothetical protein n=1 Tax=Streptomyces sp. NPDC088719 TaxID=3365872 RepID=UPI0038200DA9
MGLLEERKLTAQQRAESLREEADQVLAAPEGPEPPPEPAESDRAVGRRTAGEAPASGFRGAALE